MKDLVILVLTGIFSINLYAQHTENLDFYVGTWKYENQQTGEEFVLKLRKTSYVLHNNVSPECVVGAYTYKKNGQIVTDCMDKFSLNLNIMPVFATNSSQSSSSVNPNRLYMYVTDYGKFCPNGDTKRTRSNELLLESNASPNKIRWILKNDRGPVLADEAPPEEFSIPVDIILTKQP